MFAENVQNQPALPETVSIPLLALRVIHYVDIDDVVYIL